MVRNASRNRRMARNMAKKQGIPPSTATASNAGVDRRRRSPTKVSTRIRLMMLAVAAGYFLQKTFKRELFPWGSAVEIEGKELYASLDFSNDSLKVKHGRTKRIYERLEPGKEPLMKGPETVIFGKDGTLYLLTEEGKLLTMTDLQEAADGVTITADVNLVHNVGVGRPLGGRFTNDGKTLYIADAILGLTRIHNPRDPKSKVELVASTFVDEGKEVQMLYVDDICIGPKTGKVYFSDASDIAPDRIGTKSWDTLHASKVDLMRGKGTGRILEYDPSTDEVTVLASGLRFANGIAVDQNESFVLFCETFGVRLWKYHLKGDKKGTLEVAVDSKDMVGYLDGADCDWSKNGKCYAVLPSAIVPFHKLIAKLPTLVDIGLRNLLMLLPRSLVPKPKKYGGIIELSPNTNEFRYIQDPTGEDIAMLTGVTVHDGKLYLGSLENNFIGVYSLEEK